MTKLYCGNFPLIAITSGIHPNSDNAILISINDPNGHCTPKKSFLSVHTFNFHDINKEMDGLVSISDLDVSRMADIINHAKDINANIFVHCHAGLCRSGAVVEALILYGFELIPNHPYSRLPNSLVFSKLRRELGLTHSFENI